MDLRQYYILIKKSLVFIIVTIVVFVGAALFMTYRKPINYQASSSVEVTRAQKIKQDAVDYYQYDNYYSVVVAASLSDNVLSLIGSPSVVSEVFQKAGYDVPKGDVSDLGKTFTAKKKVATSSVVDISYASSDEMQANRMILTAQDVLKTKIADYNKATESADFGLIANTPVVIAQTKSYAINGVIAGLVALFVSLTIAFLKEALVKK